MPYVNSIGISRVIQELAEHTDRVIFVYQLDPKVFSYLNPAFDLIWQKARESVRSNPASILKTIYPEDISLLTQAYHRLMNGEQVQGLEFRILHPDKSVRWLRLNAFLVEQEPDNFVIAGIIEDITTMKEHYGNMQKFAAKKDSVMEILTHDLAGPLTNIKGVSTLLSERLKTLKDTDLNKMIEIISKASERSILMIREFVKQKFLESADTGLIKKKVDVVRMVQEIIDQYKTSEGDIRRNFKLFSSSDKVYVEIDDSKFGQVIDNLISNSIKFTYEDGCITIGIEDQEKVVLITVADNGIGIPADRHEELFEKFTKARRPGLKGEPSVGLGMSVVKTIVDWHQGKIWFKSQEQKGTTFYIELPRGDLTK